MRSRAQSIVSELVAALPSQQAQRVQSLPLVFDDTVGEVNAFAACTRTGSAILAISDGLLLIQVRLAQARAVDEFYGSRKVDEYIRFLAQHQQPKSPILPLPAGLIDVKQSADPRKLARQRDIFDEQIAFVLGHELAHHYLGHLPCTPGGAIPLSEVGRLLADTVPVFNQPLEIAADIGGTQNVLTAGAHRSGYRWTENGGLLTMQFFQGVDQFSPIDILFGFERSHPSPALRTPIIQQTAAAFRASGGVRWPWG